jgi:hypothetical protein
MSTAIDHYGRHRLPNASAERDRAADAALDRDGRSTNGFLDLSEFSAAAVAPAGGKMCISSWN